MNDTCNLTEHTVNDLFVLGYDNSFVKRLLHTLSFVH